MGHFLPAPLLVTMRLVIEANIYSTRPTRLGGWNDVLFYFVFTIHTIHYQSPLKLFTFFPQWTNRGRCYCPCRFKIAALTVVLVLFVHGWTTEPVLVLRGEFTLTSVPVAIVNPVWNVLLLPGNTPHLTPTLLRTNCTVPNVGQVFSLYQEILFLHRTQIHHSLISFCNKPGKSLRTALFAFC